MHYSASPDATCRGLGVQRKYMLTWRRVKQRHLTVGLCGGALRGAVFACMHYAVVRMPPDQRPPACLLRMPPAGWRAVLHYGTTAHSKVISAYAGCRCRHWDGGITDDMDIATAVGLLLECQIPGINSADCSAPSDGTFRDYGDLCCPHCHQLITIQGWSS